MTNTEARNQKFNRIIAIEAMTSNLARAELALAMMTMDEQETAEYLAYRAEKKGK